MPCPGEPSCCWPDRHGNGGKASESRGAESEWPGPLLPVGVLVPGPPESLASAGTDLRAENSTGKLRAVLGAGPLGPALPGGRQFPLEGPGDSMRPPTFGKGPWPFPVGKAQPFLRRLARTLPALSRDHVLYRLLTSPSQTAGLSSPRLGTPSLVAAAKPHTFPVSGLGVWAPLGF